MVAKVEWHQGELWPRVGFIVTNLTRPSRRVVGLIVLGVIGLLALVVWLPWLTRSRDVLLETPGPPPARQATPIALPQGGRTCVDHVTLDTELR